MESFTENIHHVYTGCDPSTLEQCEEENFLPPFTFNEKKMNFNQPLKNVHMLVLLETLFYIRTPETRNITNWL